MRLSSSKWLAAVSIGFTLVGLSGSSLAANGPTRCGLQRDELAAPPATPAATFLKRGNSALRNGDAEEALEAFAESARLARLANDPTGAAFARANAARARVERIHAERTDSELESDLAQLLKDTGNLATDARGELAIHVARTLAILADRRAGELSAASLTQAATLLANTAKTVEDPRLRSFALGYRGALYESTGQLAEARTLTRRALREADRAGAADALYRWRWQLARIARQSGEPKKALDGYRSAIRTLDTLRAEIAISDGDRAFQFDTEVEPAYLEFVDLLLAESRPRYGRAEQALLREARDTLESLKSAEIANHFEDACLTSQQRAVPDAIPKTAVLYPVLLPDRVELLLGTEDALRVVRAPVEPAELEARVTRFRQLLVKRTTRQYMRDAEALYDALIRPMNGPLFAARPEVLVVVPSGVLRTIPFAALYDARRGQFLIERIALAMSPALALTDPRPLRLEAIESLVAGISEPVQGYARLPHVETEVASIRDDFPSVVLLNEAFQRDAFVENVRERAVGILHVASHGEFLPNADDSYLLTYDGRLSMDRLAETVGRTRLRNEKPLELIILSACETAAGSERAALGLAGVAVRSGARSALATLWSVNDEGTAKIIDRFYQALSQGQSRAEAIRAAQLSMLAEPSFRHPNYWAAFLLISSWL